MKGLTELYATIRDNLSCTLARTSNSDIIHGPNRSAKFTPAERRKIKVFGKMRVTKVFGMSKLETTDEAVARLLEFAEYPQIFRWFQFPTALVVLVAHADSPDSGAVYVYDRKQCVWLWVDFNDQNYGGYSPSEFDVLINQCHFFRLAASPALLESPVQWMVAPGQGPKVMGRLPA